MKQKITQVKIQLGLAFKNAVSRGKAGEVNMGSTIKFHLCSLKIAITDIIPNSSNQKIKTLGLQGSKSRKKPLSLPSVKYI